MSQVTAALGDVHHRARTVTLMPVRTGLVHQASVAHIEALPVDLGLHSAPGQLRDRADAAAVEVAAVRRDDGCRDRMARIALRRGGDIEQLRLADLLGVDGVHGKAPLRQGAGLVKNHGVHTAERLHIVCALDQHADTRGPADAAEEAQRYRNDQRAGAGHHQEDQRAVDPIAPRAAPKQRGKQRQQHRADDHRRRIPAGKAGNDVLDTRFFLGGVLHQLQNPRHGALGIDTGGLHLQQPGEVDAARDHLVAHGHVHGHTFPGQRGGIHAAAALKHHAVQRDTLPGADNDRLPERDLLRVYLALLAVAQDVGIIRADIHERRDGLAAASHGHGLEPLPDLIEQHHRRGLGVLPDGKGAKGGHRHEKFLIEHLAVGDVPHRRPEHIPADDQVRHHEHQRAHQPRHGQQRRSDGQYRRREDAKERFFLTAGHFRITRQSGSTRATHLTAALTTSSKRSSSASMVIFWVMKLTLALVTPSSFLMAASIFAAQLAQSRSSSLNVFFMVVSSLLLMFFDQVLKALGDDCADMIVRQEIIDGLALPAVADEIGVLENTELVGNGRLRHPQKLRNRAHAHLRLEQRVENLHPRGVGKNLEQVAQIAQQFVGGKLMAHTQQEFVMVMRHDMSLRSYELLFI